MENNDIFQEETIDIREIFYKVWRHWEIFLIGIVLSTIIVYFINKYQKPVYSVSSTILINDQKTAFDPQAMLGIDFYDQQNKIQNEIQILQSYSMIKQVVENLKIGISYFEEEIYFSKELYKKTPFYIEIDSNHVQPIGITFELNAFSNDSSLLIINEGEFDKYIFNNDRITGIDFIEPSEIFVKNNQWVESENYRFKIHFNESYKPENNYFFCFNTLNKSIQEFSNLKFEVVDKSSIISITLEHSNLLKGVDFLNSLTGEFLKKELLRKNKTAEKSLIFIDNHLTEINDSLYQSEKQLQDFQSEKSALNIEFQSQAMFTNLETLQNKKAEALIQKKYYTYLTETLNKNNPMNDIIAPSLMNINNPILNSQIANLINQQSELNNMRFDNNNENPYVKSLFTKIENSKRVLKESAQNEIKNLDLTLEESDKRIEKVLENINAIPKKQRELFNYERNFKIYDNIYTFLLQKRSETLLARASNVPLNEIIDIARVNNHKITGTNKKLNYLIGFVLGLIIPAGFIYLKYYFNSKIINDIDIEKETTYPILGHIIKQKTKEENFVFANPKSPIAESFRMLRTNLDFARKHNKSQVVLVSSTMQGEGKSFISNNLAHSLAISEKKTVLLMFDLRKPKLYLNVPKTDIGLSNYLIGKAKLTDIIQSTGIENLSLIQSGTIPPNPSELINASRTEVLFTELRKCFDYIIVDTPPIGIISEGITLTKYSDINLCVIRYNYTRIKHLSNLLKGLSSKNISNLNLVTNFLETGKKAYGYGYNYENYEY